MKVISALPFLFLGFASFISCQNSELIHYGTGAQANIHQAERIYRDYVFSHSTGMNLNAEFPLQELGEEVTRRGLK